VTDHRRLYERPLARAHALAESWTGDRTPITRDEAAALLHDAIDPAGWAETNQRPVTLAAVPDTPAVTHDYLSTGCLHGEHAYCQGKTGQAGAKKPAQCKFCEAKCLCDCHGTGGETRLIGVPLLADADPPINLGNHIAGYNDLLNEETDR
jgi:hypothetical protein